MKKNKKLSLMVRMADTEEKLRELQEHLINSIDKNKTDTEDFMVMAQGLVQITELRKNIHELIHNIVLNTYQSPLEIQEKLSKALGMKMNDVLDRLSEAERSKVIKAMQDSVKVG